MRRPFSFKSCQVLVDAGYCLKGVGMHVGVPGFEDFIELTNMRNYSCVVVTKINGLVRLLLNRIFRATSLIGQISQYQSTVLQCT